MSLPVDQVKRETIKKYAQEKIANLRQQELLKFRSKEIDETVKESELMDTKEFNLMVKTAMDIDKVQEDVDKKSDAIANVEILGL